MGGVGDLGRAGGVDSVAMNGLAIEIVGDLPPGKGGPGQKSQEDRRYP